MSIKHIRFGLLTLATVAFTTPAMAQGGPGITGAWSGEVELPTGQTLPFAAFIGYDGDEVIGFLEGIGGPDVPIFDGEVEGNVVTFSSIRPVGDGDVQFNYRGELDGDTMTFTIDREDGEGAPLTSETTRLD